MKTAVIHECKPADKDDRPADEQKWCLYTSDGSRLLGRHPSKEKAENQERAIQVNKHASLRSRTIRLAHAKPELRGHLLPLLKVGGKWHEKFKLGQRVEVRTFLNGKETWNPGIVSDLPRLGVLGNRWVGEFRVKRDGLGHTQSSEVPVHDRNSIRPL